MRVPVMTSQQQQNNDSSSLGERSTTIGVLPLFSSRSLFKSRTASTQASYSPLRRLSSPSSSQARTVLPLSSRRGRTSSRNLVTVSDDRRGGGHVCNAMLNLEIQTVRLLLRILAYIQYEGFRVTSLEGGL
ncbi:hypothetical protein CDL15_Pgr015939 [Punica granatum]|uniref:Uncharacterized protein n=1 Tax=Punica granatum TaxID=22663 RepID=A0A218XPL6_PUNGR|nr:hypothetical protein CDL15_Pgr015939 [Punica granatum]